MKGLTRKSLKRRYVKEKKTLQEDPNVANLLNEKVGRSRHLDFGTD
jgi:hypothetical protein